MAKRTWQSGVDNAQLSGEAPGRLQVFRLGSSGTFSLVTEMEPIGRKAAGRVPRPRDGVAEFRSGENVVRFSRDPLVLEQFKDWRSGMMRVRV